MPRKTEHDKEHERVRPEALITPGPEQEAAAPLSIQNHSLLDAAYYGDLKRLTELLEQGADVNAADPKTGLTPLHIAVGTNNLPMTKALIEHWKADIKPDGRGRWPTIIAGQCRVSAEMCDYIVEKEAALPSTPLLKTR